MHRLRAVVKSFKADPVCQALIKIGVDEVYVEEVQGYGRQKGHLGLYRQPTYGIAFLPKIAITAYVTDALVEPACKAIEEVAITGTIGDGKIFITPIDYAIPHVLESGGLAASGERTGAGVSGKRANRGGRVERAGRGGRGVSKSAPGKARAKAEKSASRKKSGSHSKKRSR